MSERTDKGAPHERFSQREFVCPFMRYYRKRKVLCENGYSPGVDPEHVARYCKSFAWEACEIAQKLTEEYEHAETVDAR